jgi:hypothetical protein
MRSALCADPETRCRAARVLVAARVALRVEVDAMRRPALAPHAARWRARVEREVVGLRQHLDRLGADIGERLAVRCVAQGPSDPFDLFTPAVVAADGYGIVCLLADVVHGDRA